MALGRTTQVSVGSDAFNVSTRLRTGATPTIETLVSSQGQILFRTSVSIDDLKPVFAHGDEILRRVKTQHSSVVGKIRENGMSPMFQEAPAASSQQPLDRALSHLHHKELRLAENELRRLLASDPGFAEAKQLLDIVRTAGSQKASITSTSDRLRVGAEALTRGWKSSAIQNWARALSADPSNRIFQLLILLTTTPSAQRRTRYLHGLLDISKGLLAGDRSEEAHALLLALQAIEDPERVSPQSSEVVPETRGAVASSSSNSAAPRQLKPSDTQPAAITPLAHEDAFPWLPRSGESVENEDSVAADIELSEVAEPADDGEHDRYPEREAALFEASRAEWEASRKEKPAASLSSVGHLSKQAIWERLGAPSMMALASVGVLVLLAAGLAFWPEGTEQERYEIERAAGLAAAGQFTQAITVYNQILDRGQLQSLAYLGRARARLTAGEVEEGLSDLTRAAELAPGSIEILEETADSLYSRGRFAKAVEYYSRTIALGRDSANVRYRLAESLVQLNRNSEALTHLETAIGLEASHGEARYLYGKLLNDLGRYAEAEQQIRGARAHFDPGRDYYVELATTLLKQGKLDGAEEIARELERHDPSDARAHTLLGEVYLGRKRLDAARNELIMALQTNAEQPRAHLALARVWLAFGRSREDPADLIKARQILEEGHGIPESERLLVLAEVSFAEGDPQDAIILLVDALAHGCERLPARLALAEARFAAGDLAGAAEELEAADLLAPTDAAIALSLGLVHSQRKDFPFASKEYLKALHRAGLTQPVQEDSGPVVLPFPYVALPPRFDVNRAIRDTYRRVLAENEHDEIANALKNIAESTSFLIGGPA